jgi:hypothetical protein
LDSDDRLGASEVARQIGVILFQYCDFRRQRIGFDRFFGPRLEGVSAPRVPASRWRRQTQRVEE